MGDAYTPAQLVEGMARALGIYPYVGMEMSARVVNQALTYAERGNWRGALWELIRNAGNYVVQEPLSLDLARAWVERLGWTKRDIDPEYHNLFCWERGDRYWWLNNPSREDGWEIRTRDCTGAGSASIDEGDWSPAGTLRFALLLYALTPEAPTP